MKKIFIPFIALVAMTITSCEKEDDQQEFSNVSLSFSHKVGSENLEFDTLKYTNVANHKYEVTKLEYFVSNITFHHSNGEEYTVAGPLYVNAEEANTLNQAGLELPQGNYSGVSLTMGLDTAMNKSNTLTTAEAVAMAWPDQMGGGYHYMKFEGRYDSLETGNVKNFALHTGASGGTAYDFKSEFLNANFTVGADNLVLNITMDVNEWFTGDNVYDFVDYGSRIMGNQSAQLHLKNNGPSVFNISIKK